MTAKIDSSGQFLANTDLATSEQSSQALSQTRAGRGVAIKGVDQTYLCKVFRRCVKKFNQILHLESRFHQIPETKENFVERTNALTVLQNLKVWALHYLSKGAKIPIYHQRGPLHLSIVDYLRNDNEASYYRGDGGSIISAFRRHFKEKYLGNSQCKFGVVKPSKFSALIQGACSDKMMIDCYNGPFKYRKIDDLNMIAGDSGRSFLDISSVLMPAYKKQGGDWEKQLKAIQNKVDQLPEETIVGGLVAVDQGVGVYIIFTPTKERNEKIQSDIDDGLMVVFKNLRGAIGAFPDVMFLKNALIKEGFNLQKIVDSQPFSSNMPSQLKQKVEVQAPSTTPSQEVKQKVEQELDKVLSLISAGLKDEQINKHPLVRHYYPLIWNLLTELRKESLINFNDPEYQRFIGEVALNAIEKASKQIKKINDLLLKQTNCDGAEKYNEILQRIYLGVEEVLSMIPLFEPHGKPLRLIEQMERTLPLSPSFNQSGKPRSFFAFSSGMSGHDYIVESLLSAQNRSGKEPKTKVVFLEGSYYELTSDTGLKARFADSCDSKVLSVSELISSQEECDLLCLDLHPNFVTIPKASTNPVVEIVTHLLQRRKSKEPLTVVLDTSTTLISDEQVRKIIEHFKNDIEAGRLNLLVESSLAKFYNMGLDKYPGGMVEFYGNPENPFTGQMQNYLRQKETEDPISHESERFFTLILSSSAKEITEFHRQIRDNNDQLYNLLKGGELQQKKSPIRLAERSQDVPMLGFQFDSFVESILGDDEGYSQFHIDQAKVRITKLMESYIYNKAHSMHLPLTIRGSFPFPNSAIVECHTALRFVLGLEEGVFIKQYAELFEKAGQELSQFINSSSSLKEELKNTLIDISEEDFQDLVSAQIPSPENRGVEAKSEPITFLDYLNKFSKAEI